MATYTAGSLTSYFRVHKYRSSTVLLSVTLVVFSQMLIAVSGNAVHLTMVTTTPYGAGMSQVRLSCFRSSPDTYVDLSFGRPFMLGIAGSSIWTDTTLPRGTYSSTYTTPSAVTQYLPVSVDSTGLFYCEGSSSGMTTRVYSIVHSIHRKFEPADGLLTKTINKGDDVTLSVNSVNGGQTPLWHQIRNGTVFEYSSSAYTITVPSSDVMDGDLFAVIESGLSVNDNHFGMIRMIVRGCSAGQWGPPDCTGVCNQCYNGGVCDDETGQCICAPGFSGPNCLTACGMHRFGWACEFQCESGNLFTSCTGSQFGLPDPYGSSCISGYSGRDCNTVCDAGKFGAGCTEMCHCPSGTCDKYTGMCSPSGCASGWSGTNCQVQGTGVVIVNDCPVQGVTVTAPSGTTSMTVYWIEPTATDEFGQQIAYSSRSPSPGQVILVGLTVQVMYTFTAVSGLFNTCTFIVTVNLPVNIVDCPTQTVTAAGLTDTQVTWTEPTATDASGQQITNIMRSHQPGDVFNIGQATEVTYKFTADSGHQATCKFCVVVNRAVNIISCPSQPVTVIETTGASSKSATWTEPIAINSMNKLITNIMKTHQPGDTFNVGETTVVTYTFTDDISGLYDTCTFSVTVNGAVNIHGCPDLLTLAVSGATTTSVTWTEPTATDGFGQLITIIMKTHEPGAFFTVGQTTQVIYTFTDYSGNKDTCTFNVTVGGIIEFQTLTMTNPGQDVKFSCAATSGDTLSADSLYLVPVGTAATTQYMYMYTSYEGNVLNNTFIVPGLQENQSVLCLLAHFGQFVSTSNTVSFLVLPRLSQQPMLTPGSSSVEVTWNAWNSSLMDSGDGPIVSYKVYYSPASSSSWNEAGTVSVTDQSKVTYHNVVQPLEANTSYRFSVAAIREGQGGEGPMSPESVIQTLPLPPVTEEPRTSMASSTPQDSTTVTSGNSPLTAVLIPIVVVILLVILIVILLLILVRHIRSQRKSHVTENSLPGTFETVNDMTMINSVENPMIAMDTVTPNGNRTPEPQQRPTSSASQMSALDSSHQFSGLPFKPTDDMDERETRPLPIPLKDFVEYVHTCIRTGKLRDEWASLPGADAMYSCDVSQRPKNKVKNRYRNIPAYDHCRVVLETIDDDPDSDYINASYIKGYLKDKAYIATQGPNPATVQDFWRMVWQENVAVIVNGANLVEDGKSKCVKYWPDKGKAEIFGSIHIDLEDEQMKGEYVVRTMKVANVNKKEIPRQIIQYHYIQWPDKDVPKDVTPVLNFIKEFSDASPKDSGPFLVHCSAGVGRTGAIISIHASIKRAQKEKSVDVYNFVSDMRDHRNNTVQTPAQYVFIHLALLEALFSTDTRSPESDLKKKLSVLNKKNKMADEFNKLEIITPVPAPERCRHSLAALNENKNRFPNTIFTEAVRPYLMTPRDDGIEYNYINASFIEGFKARDMFIVTQAPLPNTVIDLWRLIYDYELTSLVMLNSNGSEDGESPQYWPSSGSKDYGPFTVTNVHLSSHTGYIVSHLQITHRRQQRQRNIRHYQFTDWPESEATPKSPNALLRLILAVEKDKKDERQSPIVVQCIDGLGRSGVFCTLKNSLDRVRMESVVDIMQTIKVLRLSRPNMVATLTLYRFCYEAMVAFIDNPNKLAEEDKETEVIYQNMPGDQAAETNPKEENIYQNLEGSEA